MCYPYHAFTGRSRLDKAVNSLLGVIEGIAADSIITKEEAEFLSSWINENHDLALKHPFNELEPVVLRALNDGTLSATEKADLQWLCNALRSQEYYDVVAADMQRLHGILTGIAADGRVTEAEVRELSAWIAKHQHLKSCWPYDEIDTLVTSVLSDGHIDECEHRALVSFFAEFTGPVLQSAQGKIQPPESMKIEALCAVCPEIVFGGSTFCFTGESSKYSRSEFHKIVQDLGGKSRESVSKRLNYLVVGANGNPCWAYACYGRKVEEAMNLRREGQRIVIVHENDFQDAVMDHNS